MTFLDRGIKTWGQDRLLGKVIRNSGYLFSSNIISAILSILTANLLGVERFGALGIIIALVSNVNRLFSFRMGDVIVRYVGEYIARDEKQKAAAIVKAAALAETATSLFAFIVLVVLAPLGARWIVKDISTTPLIILYGISILGMFSTETATGILQVGNHYRSQSLINLIQAIVTALIIVYAYFGGKGIETVLIAYLAGKLIAGFSPIYTAFRRMPQLAGADWWKASFSNLPPRKELISFAVSTNLSGTINMIVRDSELLWIGAIFTTDVAGYYKTAMAIINLVIMPINPFIATTYPEITKAIATKMWAQLKMLLRRVTIIAGGWTITVSLFILVFGKTILFTPWIPWQGSLHSIYKPEYLPSLPVLLVLILGFGIANSLYWNRSLLLAFGKADAPLRVSLWATIVKVILTITLVPKLGYLFEAVLMSLYLAVTVGILVWIGLRLVKQHEGIGS